MSSSLRAHAAFVAILAFTSACAGQDVAPVEASQEHAWQCAVTLAGPDSDTVRRVYLEDSLVQTSASTAKREPGPRARRSIEDVRRDDVAVYAEFIEAEENWELWVRRDGETRNVSRSPTSEFSPCWAEDGRTILYLASDVPSRRGQRLCVMSADGSETRVLHVASDPMDTLLPSPSRRYFSYQSLVLSKSKGKFSHRDLVILEWRDGSVRERHRIDGPVRALAWHPEKDAMAVVSGDELILVDATTGKKTLLGRVELVVDGSIDWQPDGKALLVSAAKWVGAAEFARDLPHGLWRFAADGSGTTAEAVIRGIPVDIEWQRKESSERAAPPANRALRSRE